MSFHIGDFVIVHYKGDSVIVHYKHCSTNYWYGQIIDIHSSRNNIFITVLTTEINSKETFRQMYIHESNVSKAITLCA